MLPRPEPDHAFNRWAAGRVVLRRFRSDDLGAFLQYRRDPDVARYQSWEPDVDEVVARGFLAAVNDLHPGVAGEWFQFAVADAASDELLGDCALQIDAADPRQAEIGYSLAARHHGQGFGTDAVTGLLDYCFGTLSLHRVRATTDVRNEASVRLLERVGLRREAHCIESAWWKGEWTSEYHYAVLAREWPASRP